MFQGFGRSFRVKASGVATFVFGAERVCLKGMTGFIEHQEPDFGGV